MLLGVIIHEMLNAKEVLIYRAWNALQRCPTAVFKRDDNHQ